MKHMNIHVYERYFYGGIFIDKFFINPKEVNGSSMNLYGMFGTLEILAKLSLLPAA